MLIALLKISEIEADTDSSTHCPDIIRSLIQDGCKHLQRVLKQRKEASKNQLEHQRSKRETNDVMELLNSTQNDTNSNYIADNDDDDDSAKFSIQFQENECKYINLP